MNNTECISDKAPGRHAISVLYPKFCRCSKKIFLDDAIFSLCACVQLHHRAYVAV